jgi:hypothetical protein
MVEPVALFVGPLRVSSMVRGIVVALALVCALESPSAWAQALTHGKLRVVRAAKGQINLTSGQAAFKIRNWEVLLADTSNGVNPANEPITIGIAEERFLIPAGELQGSRNGKRFRYKTATDRGIQQLKLILTPQGPIRITMKIVGVDLSSLIIGDPPLCLPFAIIIGDDDGFSGVSFDRPRPYPSQLLTIPGFCTNNTEWPWA